MADSAPVSLPKGFVEFYKDIETWQNQVFFRLKKKSSISQVDAISLLEQYQQPLIEFTEFEVDIDDYQEAFMDLVRLIQGKRDKSGEFMERLLADKGNLPYEEMIRSTMHYDRGVFEQLQEKLGVPCNVTVFVAQNALRPFLRVFALPYEESIRQDEDISWGQGVCPVCGALPSISRVRFQDGRRFLFCSECFTEWEHRYLACIFCGNDEPNTIKYMVVEGDEANQLFVCDKCKGYLKNYDERNGTARNDMFITSVRTIYLDLLAEQQGYGLRETDFN